MTNNRYATLLIAISIMLIGPIILFTTFAQNSPPYAGGLCIYSDSSLERSDDILASLIDYGQGAELRTYDRSRTASPRASHQNTVKIEYWSRLLFPRFQIKISINPEYGDSDIVLYAREGWNKQGNQEVAEIATFLKNQFSFKSWKPVWVADENNYSCDLNLS